MSKIYYWEKLMCSKLVRKVNFSQRKFEEIHYTSFEEQQVQGVQGNIYFGIIFFSCILSTKPSLGLLLMCFDREIKCF